MPCTRPRKGATGAVREGGRGTVTNGTPSYSQRSFLPSFLRWHYYGLRRTDDERGRARLGGARFRSFLLSKRQVDFSAWFLRVRSK